MVSLSTRVSNTWSICACHGLISNYLRWCAGAQKHVNLRIFCHLEQKLGGVVALSPWFLAGIPRDYPKWLDQGPEHYLTESVVKVVYNSQFPHKSVKSFLISKEK